jgi:hypothetical protein
VLTFCVILTSVAVKSISALVFAVTALIFAPKAHSDGYGYQWGSNGVCYANGSDGYATNESVDPENCMVSCGN